MDDWMVEQKIVPKGDKKEFFCGASFFIKGKKAFKWMRENFESEILNLSSHHLRKQRRTSTEKGQILYGLTHKNDTFFQYERFPTWCIPCHFVTWVQYKCGHINIGPDGISKHTPDKPIEVKWPLEKRPSRRGSHV